MSPICIQNLLLKVSQGGPANAQLGVVRGGDSWLIVEAMESGWGDESHGVSVTMVTIIRRPRAQGT